MRRMELAQDEELRQQGWRVFRSSTRDRLVPSTSPPAKLQRVKIGVALAALGVTEGAVVSAAERDAYAALIRNPNLQEREPPWAGPGETKYIHFNVQNVNPNTVPQPDEFIVLGTSPFTGFLTEFTLTFFQSPISVAMAIRNTGGYTMSQSFSNFPVIPGTLSLGPDFFDPFFIAQSALGNGRTVERQQMPVQAGDEIIMVLRQVSPVNPGQQQARGWIGIEEMRNQVDLAQTLSIAQRRRQRAELLRTDVENAEMRRQITAQAIIQRDSEVVSGLLFPPFRAPAAQAAVAARVPAPRPAPRVAAPKPEPPAGSDKTFVSAWNPSFGMIGYLIPDPPRGGKVNVFDNKYSVFDITGKLVAQGQIEPIATDADIPPGASISGVRGGIKSPAMRQDTIEAFA